MGGKLQNERNSENKRTYISNLKYAAEILEKEGILGVIEPINSITVPGYFLNDYTLALEVLKEVKSQNLKMMVDLFHLQMITGNITNNLKELMNYIGHVQVIEKNWFIL